MIKNWHQIEFFTTAETERIIMIHQRIEQFVNKAVNSFDNRYQLMTSRIGTSWSLFQFEIINPFDLNPECDISETKTTN